MKTNKLVAISLILIVITAFSSCTPAGSSFPANNSLALPTGDTLNFMRFFPEKGIAIWVGYSNTVKTLNMTYQEGKNMESVIYVIGKKDRAKIINGEIISDSDSIVVIKKKR